MSFTPDISVELFVKLKSIDRKRKLAEWRYSLWIAAPFLVIFPFVLAFATNSHGMFVFAMIWIFVVLFGLGAIIHVVIANSDDVSKQFKKTVMPEMMRLAGIEGDFAQSHTLSVEAFLKSGLYRERYSHFERYDSIVGKHNGIPFGLYELAVQVSSGRSGTVGVGVGVTPGYQLMTTHFYGWVLHVIIPRLSGRTYVLPLKRKTGAETDDWLTETQKVIGHSEALTFLPTGDAAFDAQFAVFTSLPQEARRLLHPALRKFLLEAYTLCGNAPAFSFVENRAFMHVGIQGTSFDLQRGEPLIPGQTTRLLNLLNFFCHCITQLYAAGTQK